MLSNPTFFGDQSAQMILLALAQSLSSSESLTATLSSSSTGTFQKEGEDQQRISNQGRNPNGG